MRILSLDFGTKRIGIAISDPLGKYALPLEIVNKNDIINILERLIEQENISRIIMGNPINMDGSESEIGKQVLQFKRELEKKLKIPVILVDERFSSMEAEKTLKCIGERHLRKKRDAISACLILEKYLESER